MFGLRNAHGQFVTLPVLRHGTDCLQLVLVERDSVPQLGGPGSPERTLVPERFVLRTLSTIEPVSAPLALSSNQSLHHFVNES